MKDVPTALGKTVCAGSLKMAVLLAFKSTRKILFKLRSSTGFACKKSGQT